MSREVSVENAANINDVKNVVDFATVQFRFEDSSDPFKNLDPLPPDNIISFTYEDTIASEADKVNIELFDTTWTTIENLIIEKQNKIQFRFGWTLGNKSVWKKFNITSHTPTFEIHGLRLSVEGYDSSVEVNDEAQTRDWRDRKYIHEIIKDIADSKEWDYDSESVVNTKEVLDEEGKTKIFIQRQMPDMTFITTELLKYAQTEDDKGGFTCWYDTNTNKLYFRPPKFEDPVTRTYIVNKHRFGSVISFSPDLGDGSLQRQIGAINTRVVGLDPFKRELFDVVVDNKQSTDNKVLLDRYIPDQTIKTKGGAGKYMHEAVHTQKTAEMLAKQRWFARFNMYFSAELEVIGDPEIQPGTNIGVLVLDSNNAPFYCSGKYFVESVTHTIDNGNYTSRLKLWKNAMRVGTLDAKTNQLGNILNVVNIFPPAVLELLKNAPQQDIELAEIIAATTLFY